MTYEAALRTLVLEPLKLEDTLFFSRELMTRRCAVGHQRLQDGGITVQPYGLPRAENGVGGLATTTRDLIAWARFHLRGERSVIRRIREPTVEAPGWSSGDAVGLSWLLDDVAGLRVVGHGGAMPGQLSMFKLVPERGFALAACTNCHPTGAAFNERLMRWAWEAVLDAPITEPETPRAPPRQCNPSAESTRPSPTSSPSHRTATGCRSRSSTAPRCWRSSGSIPSRSRRSRSSSAPATAIASSVRPATIGAAGDSSSATVTARSPRSTRSDATRPARHSGRTSSPLNSRPQKSTISA